VPWKYESYEHDRGNRCWRCQDSHLLHEQYLTAFGRQDMIHLLSSNPSAPNGHIGPPWYRLVWAVSGWEVAASLPGPPQWTWLVPVGMSSSLEWLLYDLYVES
jgi:hypothetical protein